MPTILQVNLRFDCSPAELAPIFRDVAGEIATVPGLRWKIWLANDTTREAGGHYLFDDDAAVDAYLHGPIVAAMQQLPHLIGVDVKRFHPLPELTTVTRGPLARA